MPVLAAVPHEPVIGQRQRVAEDVGTYIASPDSKAYEDLDGFVRHLAGDRLDRLVWGTDWPHVTESSKPDDAVLINLLARWLSEDEIRLVLVENAARLYRFTLNTAARSASK